MENSRMSKNSKTFYAFHIETSGFQGIELYTLDERGMMLSQAFYSPEAVERVDACMVTAKDLGLSEVRTVKVLDGIKFPYEIQRRALEEIEIFEFARKGLKVITLDKIR